LKDQHKQCLYWANLGDALHQLPSQGEEAQKADEQALDFCDRELGINPKNRDALLVKSKLLARSGQIEEALAAVKVYNSLNSHDPMDKLYLALVFLRSGDMAAVKNTLEQAVQQGYPRTLILAEPEFAPVRNESWFRSLLKESDQ
jgi:tetratricopeptide (TPR) repeat protein